MQAPAIVKAFDVVEDDASRLLQGVIAMLMEPFGFQRAKETLHSCDYRAKDMAKHEPVWPKLG